MTLQPVQSLDAAAKRKAYDDALISQGHAQGYELGRAERFGELDDAHSKELARREALHSESDRKAEAHGFWRGAALAGILGLLIGAAVALWGASVMMFSTGAVTDRAISRVTPGQTYGLQALPEDSQPVDPLPGYNRRPDGRPLHEPASAP